MEYTVSITNKCNLKCTYCYERHLNTEYGCIDEKRAADIGEVFHVGVEWLLHGEERNKHFPADRKMMEWLKDHPEVREEIWKMMEN